MRQNEGRPGSGFQPEIQLNNSEDSLGPVIVLISKIDSSDITAQFRFIAKKSQDPRERRDAALKHLAEAYYQRPEEFNDELTAVFALDSPIARRLVEASTVTLGFRQSGHEYILPCSSRLLERNDPLYQFTYWHNFLFNPALPGNVDMVGFLPEWENVVYNKLQSCD